MTNSSLFPPKIIKFERKLNIQQNEFFFYSCEVIIKELNINISLIKSTNIPGE